MDGLLPVVWPNIHAAYDRRIEPEVLLHGSPATILDRGAPLDDEGDRSGPTLGRLPKGVSHERARCPRQHSGLTDIPDTEACRVKSDRLFRRPHSGLRGSGKLTKVFSRYCTTCRQGTGHWGTAA